MFVPFHWLPEGPPHMRQPATARWASRTLLTGAIAVALVTPLPSAGAAPTTGTAVTFDDAYYQDALGKTGEPLKAALHAIISEDSTTLTYSQVWDALKATDQAPDDPNSIVLLYSGESRDADANGGAVGDWNREHVWAKSHGGFGTSPGPGTDIHHLRPTDVQVNSARGNKDFDNGGTEVEGAPGNFTDDDSWEPRDEVKGDVARMVFYMAVRYEGGDGFPDLELNDQVDNGSAPYLGKLPVLLSWHEADPPDAYETQRNEIIYDYQNNRNPFIDHPEWAAEIWG